jgi:hypothetical protein
MEVTISNSKAVINELIGLQSRLFNNLAEAVNDTHGSVQLTETTNHMKWLAGHVVSTRFMLCNVLGSPAQEPFAELFEKGKGIDDTATYPAMGELTKDWDAISAQLIKAFEAMAEDVFEGAAPIEVPVQDQTMRGMITFFMHHESYHLGQLGLLRKAHGYGAMGYK